MTGLAPTGPGRSKRSNLTHLSRNLLRQIFCFRIPRDPAPLNDGDVRFQLELMKRGVARGRERLESFDSGVLEQSTRTPK